MNQTWIEVGAGGGERRGSQMFPSILSGQLFVSCCLVQASQCTRLCEETGWRLAPPTGGAG